MMFYDWRECVMSVLGTTKIPSAIVLTLGNEVVLFVGIFLRILMIISVIMPLLSSRPRIQSLKHVQRKRHTKKTRTWIFINGNSIEF